MPLPWLRILDAMIGVTDLARSLRIRSLSQGNPDQQLDTVNRTSPAPLSGLEARLAGVVVAALKEAFDRDSRRLELERAQLEAERERAERALRLELLRQSGEREITRQRLLSGAAGATWIGTLFFSSRLTSGPPAARLAVGIGWVLLLFALAMSFVAQSRVAAWLNRSIDSADPRGAAPSGAAGVLALWLMVLGLALVGLAVLL
jgi:hypothetical protein